MKNKKVLIVSRGIPTIDEPLNGIFEWDQARALKQKGIDICYAVIDLRSVRKKRKLGITWMEKENITVYSVAIPLGPVQKEIFNYVGACAFKKLYKKIRDEFGTPDVIHAHFLDYGYMCSKVCLHEKIPLVLTDHTSDYNSICDISRYAEGIYSQASAVIAVSMDMKERIQRWTGIKTYVVHNMIDLCIPDIEMGGNNSTIQFVSAGNLVPEKNYEVLIRAFSQVRNDSWKLTIYGDGPEKMKLENLIKVLQLEDRIHLAGRVPRKVLLEVYSQYDVFVLVSKQETFGVAYIEALAQGLPVIATVNGGPRDFVDQENGVLVDPKKEDEIVAALQYMISNYRTYDKRKFSEKVRQKFSADALVENLMNVYSNL